MAPWLDQTLVLAAVLGALGFFGWRWLRPKSRAKGCSGGCCTPPKKP